MKLPARKKSLSLRGALLLCALSGALLALCFPRPGWWFLAWVALVPWLAALRVGSTWAAVLGSWLAGFVFFSILVYWLGLFGISVWLLGSLLLGLWLMLWGVLVRWTGRLGPGLRVLAAAALWCGVESARGLGSFGFTWGWLGYSQSPSPAIISTAGVVGTVGISFLIALANSALAEAVVGLRRREASVGHVARAALVCAFVVVCVLAARNWVGRGRGPSDTAIRVAVVQGSAHGPLRSEQVNVALTREEQERTLEIYQSLTEEAARQRPALIVWPESVLPGAPGQEPWIAQRVEATVRGSKAWLLAGGPYRDDAGRPYNAAYLYAPRGNLLSRYDKVKLVPFGEYVPGREWLPSLDRYHVREVDFAAGAVHRVLQAGTMPVGPMICFESIFPQIAWRLVERGAQMLVIITNDAWFGHTSAAAQHRQIAVLRAVETNRWVVRAASAGISSIISPDGRIVAEAGLYQRKAISAEIRLAGDESRMARTVTAFPWAVCGLSLALLIAPAAVGRKRRRPRAPQRPARPRRRG